MVNVYHIGKDSKGLPVYADDLISLISITNDLMNETTDYGKGIVLSNQDAYILSIIESYPGTTVTELASKLNRTRGTISLRISELAALGFVRREKRPGNDKVIHLYTTAEGQLISTRFRSALVLILSDIEKELTQHHSKEDIMTFCKVLHSFSAKLELDYHI